MRTVFVKAVVLFLACLTLLGFAHMQGWIDIADVFRSFTGQSTDAAAQSESSAQEGVVTWEVRDETRGGVYVHTTINGVEVDPIFKTDNPGIVATPSPTPQIIIQPTQIPAFCRINSIGVDGQGYLVAMTSTLGSRRYTILPSEAMKPGGNWVDGGALSYGPIQNGTGWSAMVDISAMPITIRVDIQGFGKVVLPPIPGCNS